MIEVGDLVKYNYNYKQQRDKGVWLVVDVEIDENFGELVTLKQGNKQRVSTPHHLDKISSSR
tara:strand:+ start:42 stop:227 length:186 start_codon:yes stop_codon:yes gene_type:complete